MDFGNHSFTDWEAALADLPVEQDFSYTNRRVLNCDLVPGKKPRVGLTFRIDKFDLSRGLPMMDKADVDEGYLPVDKIVMRQRLLNFAFKVEGVLLTELAQAVQDLWTATKTLPVVGDGFRCLGVYSVKEVDYPLIYQASLQLKSRWISREDVEADVPMGVEFVFAQIEE